MLGGDPLRERVELGPSVRGGEVHDEVARVLRDKGLDADERDHLGKLLAGREDERRERGRERLDDDEGQETSDHRVAVASEAARVCPNVLSVRSRTAAHGPRPAPSSGRDQKNVARDRTATRPSAPAACAASPQSPLTSGIRSGDAASLTARPGGRPRPGGPPAGAPRRGRQTLRP